MMEVGKLVTVCGLDDLAEYELKDFASGYDDENAMIIAKQLRPSMGRLMEIYTYCNDEPVVDSEDICNEVFKRLDNPEISKETINEFFLEFISTYELEVTPEKV